MITLFLGLTAANLLLLSGVFVLGWTTAGAGSGGDLYAYHVGLGVGAGLMVALVHVTVYTYFMATSKWLAAAAEKANLDPQQFVAPARRRKSRAFPLMLAPVVLTMLAMFAGAGADPMFRPLWPIQTHLVMVLAAMLANAVAAILEYRLIRAQSQCIDQTLAILNQTRTMNT
ncbi:MAG: hypothetical protein WD042_11750 [Phycisphaeraceae bacterium]